MGWKSITSHLEGEVQVIVAGALHQVPELHAMGRTAARTAVGYCETAMVQACAAVNE